MKIKQSFFLILIWFVTLPLLANTVVKDSSQLGVQNVNSYYFLLSQNPPLNLNAGCQKASCFPLLGPQNPSHPGDQQWVTINQAGWIDLEYNVCGSVSYDPKGNPLCQNYVGHVGISLTPTSSTISNVQGGTAQLGPYQKDQAFSVTFTPTPQPPVPVFPIPTKYGVIPYRGVNLSGSEFDSGFQPPVIGDALYFVNKGMNTIRLPFKWENLQPPGTLSTPIDFTKGNGKTIADLVNGYTQKGLTVLLDMHNYMRYPVTGTSGPVIGQDDSAPSKAAYAAAWGQIAAQFAKNPLVAFDIMNEPHDMKTETVLANENAAIAAIRQAETTAGGVPHLILIEGNGWSGLHGWTQNYYGTANSQVFVPQNIVDPAHRYAINVHQYFDKGDGWSGLGECSDSSTLRNDINFQAFVDYMDANKLQIVVSELGGLADKICAQDINSFLSFVTPYAFPDQSGAGFIGWTGWAAGQAYAKAQDPLSLAPVGTQEKIQVTQGFAYWVTPPVTPTPPAKSGK